MGVGGGATIIIWPEVNIKQVTALYYKICFEYSNTLILHST